MNKYTKADLISRNKRLEIQNSNNTPFSQRIIDNLLLIKNMLLKITLFALLIKTFKKFSIFRRIWVIINTIVMTIFGISILDIYGFSVIANFYLEFISILGNIINYLTHTNFYTILSGLWATKVEIKEPSSILRTNNKNATGSESSSKINDWFNKQEVVEDKSSNTKYYIIGALFLLSCLAWYYYGDNVKHIADNGIDKIKSSFSRKPGNDGNISSTNIDNDLQNNSWSNTLQNIWNKVKSKFTRNNQPPSDPLSLTPNTPAQVELINKSTKFPNVESPHLLASSSKLSPIQEVSEKSSASTSWIGENAMDQYFKDDNLDKGKAIDITNLTESEINRRILEQTTGSSLAKFELESEDVMSKMSHFVATHENQAFPNIEIKKTLCSVLSTQMTVLYLNYKKYYIDWLSKPGNDEIYDKFQAIEQEIKTSNEVQESNNYEEVAKSASQEQEAWSDDANSSVHSPYVNEEKFDNKSMLGPFLDELDKLPTQPGILEQVEAEVKAESQQTVEVPKSGINALWDAIKARRNDTNVIDDTIKEPVLESNVSTSSSDAKKSIEHYLPESQTQQTNVPNPEIKINSPEQAGGINEAPIVESTSIESTVNTPNSPLSSILEAVKGLLTPKVETKSLDTSVEGSSQEAHKSGFINLFESIKARRNDSNVVSSPKIAQVGLQTPIHERLDVTPKGSPLINKPSISNLLEDTNALFDLDDDDDIPPIKPSVDDNLVSPLAVNWDQVVTSVIDGTKVEVDFKDIWRITDEIIITTNKNHDIRYNFEDTNLSSLGSKSVTFDLKDKVAHILDKFPDVKIREIIIEDTSHNKHSIFRI
jgi:hypothetical protein